MTAPAPKAKDSSAGTQCCQGIAATMIGHLVTRLEVEAKKAGGSLDAEQIRAVAQRFIETGQARFAPVYRRAWDGCTAMREAHQHEIARGHPFDRILMKRFAHLFPVRKGSIGVLSRRMIAGFSLVVDKMIGPVLYQQCRAKSEAILRHYRLPEGGHDWERVYADRDARLLADDVLVVVAHHFADFDRRRGWFMDVVNSRLAPAARGAADEHWTFGESAFTELMHALYAPLRASVRDDPRDLRARYGDHTCETLRVFFARLDLS
jgi:hypothetical protein